MQVRSAHVTHTLCVTLQACSFQNGPKGTKSIPSDLTDTGKTLCHIKHEWPMENLKLVKRQNSFLISILILSTCGNSDWLVYYHVFGLIFFFFWLKRKLHFDGYKCPEMQIKLSIKCSNTIILLSKDVFFFSFLNSCWQECNNM